MGKAKRAHHASEALTGNRNRAIAWLLRNYLVLQDDVDAVLDTYFRQCAILVTARDLAVMAATLANRGVNPVTGVSVISPNIVARTLSVMTSSGMSTATASGTKDAPVVTAKMPEAAMRMMAARLDQSLPVGNEGAGTVIRTGSSDAAKALMGKTVSMIGGAMCCPRAEIDFIRNAKYAESYRDMP